MREIVVYSKKSGLNTRLAIVKSVQEAIDLFILNHEKINNLKEHKHFAYILLGGVEVKLFDS